MRKQYLLLFNLLIVVCLPAQVKKAPDRKEGDGPWPQLIIRGVILINGTGAPAIGPVDIVVEKNRIKEIDNGRCTGHCHQSKQTS